MKSLKIYHPVYQEYVQDFEQYLRLMGYSSSMVKNTPSYLQAFLHWLEQRDIRDISLLQACDLEAYLSHLRNRHHHQHGTPLSASYIYSHIYGLGLFFQHQLRLGNLLIHPLSGLRLAVLREKNSRRALSREEIHQLYAVCESYREKSILGLFYGCGLRLNEAVCLNYEDIHFRSGYLYVRLGKGHKRRAVPLNSKVRTDFSGWLYEERLYYSSKSYGHLMGNRQAFLLGAYGGRPGKHWYNNHLKALVSKAGLPSYISPHYLRHSIATHLLQNGLSVEQVRDFLGHGHLETTQIYTHVSAYDIIL